MSPTTEQQPRNKGVKSLLDHQDDSGLCTFFGAGNGAFPLAKAGGSQELNINQGGGKDAEADTGNRSGNEGRHSPEDWKERHIYP